MQIPVLIEPVAGGRFLARAGEPFCVTVEGADKAELLRRLESLIAQRLRQGAELVALETDAVHPVALNGGTLKDDPMFNEWVEILAENRRREDAASP